MNSLAHIDDVLSHCIHCGMCLPVCPTYAITQQEESSPRGRIRLMRSLHDGSLTMSDRFTDEMYFCLDCQACQTACPAGVQYGSLVEDAREKIADQHREPLSLRLLKKMFLRGILSTPKRTKLFGRVLRWYDRIGLRGAIDETGILGVFSERLKEKHRLLPDVRGEFFDETSPEFIPAQSQKRGRVAFLSGCIMNIAFADVHRDAVDVLTACGFDVIIPKRQVCCGSLHGHNGDVSTAKNLAKQNIDIFLQYDFDALVIDSAGCGAFLKEYGALFADDPDYADRAKMLSNKTKDISEFLSDVGILQPLSPLDVRVTYHEACHLVHTQKISRQPRDIIKQIPGVTFVELPESTWCCGSAGIYNILRFDDSMKMLERKMNNIASTNAEIVLTANPGCHLQLECGIRQSGLKMEVMHPVSFLKKAISA